MRDGVEGHVLVGIAYTERRRYDRYFLGMDRSYNVKAPG
jgi:hypothetical protein